MSDQKPETPQDAGRDGDPLHLVDPAPAGPRVGQVGRLDHLGAGVRA